MANKNPLTAWEIIRLIFGGREYAERRLPEVIASAVAERQGEHIIFGILSDWLRSQDLENENVIAAIFAVANFLKNHGYAISSEFLEGIPRVADEIRELPAIKNGTPEARRAAFKTELDNRLKNLSRDAKERLAKLNTHLEGITMPDIDTNGLGAKINIFLAQAGAAFGLGLDKAREAAEQLASFIMAMMGFSVIYCMLLILVGFGGGATLLPTIAWASFVMFVGIPALIMFLGGLGRNKSLLIQTVALTILWFFASSLLAIAFTVATVASIATNHGNWGMVIVGLIIFVVWDRLVISLTQKAVATAKWLTDTASSASDLKITEKERERAEENYYNNVFLARIGLTVTGAVSAFWIFLTIETQKIAPINADYFVLILAAELLLISAYVRMATNIWRQGDNPSHIEPLAKKFGEKLYTAANKTSIAVPVLTIVFLLAWFAFPGKKVLENWWTPATTSVVEITEDVGGIANQGTRKALAGVREVAGLPAKELDCGGKRKSAEKVQKDLDALNAASGNGDYCGGGTSGYPCNCKVNNLQRKGAM